jgi:hypothetical protein
MNEEFTITTDLDINTIPEYSTVDDIRYFEDKVKRNPWDKKAQLQLELIKKHFGIEE